MNVPPPGRPPGRLGAPPPLSGRQPRAVRSALALPAVTTLPTAARGVLEHLRGMVRWGVHLASFDGGHLRIVDPDPDHPPSDADLLARYPQVSALGRLLLAEQPDWRALVRELRTFTEHTVASPDTLTVRLAEVTRDGLARQCGELRADRGCLAVAVRAPDDRRLVAGLALSGPAHRIADPDPELVEHLREHARRLEPLLA